MSNFQAQEDEEKAEPQEGNTENTETMEQSLLHPTDEVIFDVVKAMQAGMTLEKISMLSAIDPWFLIRIKNIIDMEYTLRRHSDFNEDIIKEAKRIGFSDKQIGRCLSIDELKIRSLRHRFGIRPVIKQIDTLAAEWPAKTNYLYLTYGGQNDDILVETREKRSIIVLGAGPYRIGSSVEFDWGTVNTVWGLKENGVHNVSIINCNPETVSTDYDISDRLYFEELTFERIMDIFEKEKPAGIVTGVGGQTANNVAVISTATKTVVTHITVGVYPVAVAISPNGKELFTTGHNNISHFTLDATGNPTFESCIGDLTGCTATTPATRWCTPSSVRVHWWAPSSSPTAER